MSSIIPTGLKNIGNTCFANSVLQCMLHTPEMYAVLGSLNGNNRVKGLKAVNFEQASIRSWRQKKVKQCLPPSQPFCCVYWSIQEIYDNVVKRESEEVVPSSLLEIIPKVFGEYTQFGLQQDAHEFLIMLLHSLHSSPCIKNKKDSAAADQFEFSLNNVLMDVDVTDIFEGRFTSEVTCKKWKFSTQTAQSFQDINLVSWKL